MTHATTTSSRLANTLRRYAAGLLLANMFVVVASGSARAAELHATTANLSSVFASAQGGDTIALASGSYGQFKGGAKTSTVTLKPEPGAMPTMSLSLISNNNVRVDGVTITSAYLDSSRNIAIVNCRFTGLTRVDTRANITNAGILFDNDTFFGISVDANSYEGRLTVRGYQNTSSVGVQISNCKFGQGGESDGVQIIGGAYGVQVGPGNEFSNIRQGNFTAHCDPVQLYDETHSIVIGNYFHHNSTAIMSNDGGDHARIEGNVFDIDEYPWAFFGGGTSNATIIHNTVIGGSFRFDVGPNGVPGNNNVVRDNVSPISLVPGTTSQEDYNLLPVGQGSGAHDLRGTPQFEGGTRPTTFAGFKLKAGTLGTKAASDGKDMGASFGGTTPVNQSPSVTVTSPSNGASLTAPATISITANATDADGTVAKVEFFSGSTKLGEDLSSPYTFTWSGVAAGAYTLTAKATDNAGASTTSAVVNISVTVQNPPPTPTGSTLFTTQTPALLHNSDGVGVNYELGMRLRTSVAGQITAIRFWKDSSETGTHIGRIWSASGALLATVTFTGETASGWQRQNLATPLAIAANSEFLVSVNTGNTYYVATNNGLATQVVNGPLKSIVGSNGRYGAPGQYPTNSWQASNYFRDVVFAAGAANSTQLQQGGFEAPNVGEASGYNSFVYGPTGSAWTFANGAGISANGSGFTASNTTAPEGAQVGFVQGNGTISQSVVFTAGTYSISFKAAQRVNWQASYQVLRITVDGVAIGDFRPAGSTYQALTTVLFTVPAGAHTLSILGLNPNGGDNTAFIDAVTLTASAQTANG